MLCAGGWAPVWGGGWAPAPQPTGVALGPTFSGAALFGAQGAPAAAPVAGAFAGGCSPGESFGCGTGLELEWQ